jgi:outer membrane lipopolysaccharide assembly protein LptE/RlpB
MQMLRQLIAMALILGVCGCGGWHLRGSRTDVVTVGSVFLSTSSARYLDLALRQELNYANVRVKPSKSDVQAVIELSEEEYDRRVLSVDPDTGKVREVELGLEVKFSVRGRDGKLLIPPERLSWVQDFVFDENSLLGTTERESIIELELAQDAARSIMLRLETLEFPET